MHVIEADYKSLSQSLCDCSLIILRECQWQNWHVNVPRVHRPLGMEIRSRNVITNHLVRSVHAIRLVLTHFHVSPLLPLFLCAYCLPPQYASISQCVSRYLFQSLSHISVTAFIVSRPLAQFRLNPKCCASKITAIL